jgi:hypothetical protein
LVLKLLVVLFLFGPGLAQLGPSLGYVSLGYGALLLGLLLGHRNVLVGLLLGKS